MSRCLCETAVCKRKPEWVGGLSGQMFQQIQSPSYSAQFWEHRILCKAKQAQRPQIGGMKAIEKADIKVPTYRFFGHSKGCAQSGFLCSCGGARDRLPLA